MDPPPFVERSGACAAHALSCPAASVRAATRCRVSACRPCRRPRRGSESASASPRVCVEQRARGRGARDRDSDWYLDGIVRVFYLPGPHTAAGPVAAPVRFRFSPRRRRPPPPPARTAPGRMYVCPDRALPLPRMLSPIRAQKKECRQTCVAGPGVMCASIPLSPHTVPVCGAGSLSFAGAGKLRAGGRAQLKQ